MNTSRIRLYPYKVTYIDHLSHHTRVNGDVTVTVVIVTAKTSEEAKSKVSAKVGRAISIVSAGRYPQNRQNMGGVKDYPRYESILLTTRQLDAIGKKVWVGGMESRTVVVVPPTTTVAPKYTVPLSVGGFSVGVVESSIPSQVQTPPPPRLDVNTVTVVDGRYALSPFSKPSGFWNWKTEAPRYPLHSDPMGNPVEFETILDAVDWITDPIDETILDAAEQAFTDVIGPEIEDEKVQIQCVKARSASTLNAYPTGSSLFFDTNVEDFSVTGCPPPAQTTRNLTKVLFPPLAFIAILAGIVYGVVKVWR